MEREQEINGWGEGNNILVESKALVPQFRGFIQNWNSSWEEGKGGEEPGWETVSGALGRGGGIPQGELRNRSCSREVKFSKDMEVWRGFPDRSSLTLEVLTGPCLDTGGE